MARQFTEIPSSERGFIRQGITSNIRIDGRQVGDFRETTILLSRSENFSRSEVCFGETTRACASVKAEVVAPYPDRPNEGMMTFSAKVSPGCRGLTSQKICRYLERCIRDTDSIDLESLCISSGDKVWMILVDVVLMDSSGSDLDCCILAAMSALRAFRKPDVSLVYSDELSSRCSVTLHSSDDREPLPLALHQTPLSITLGLFRMSHLLSSSANAEMRSDVLLCDPISNEELFMDGTISVCINAHKEICSIQKPGGIGVSPKLIREAIRLASTRAADLHRQFTDALNSLETEDQRIRETRLEWLRNQNLLLQKQGERQASNEIMEVDNTTFVNEPTSFQQTGIQRNDPILQYGNLHAAVGVRED